jgi:membrane-associated phospholipid phosphatase
VRLGDNVHWLSDTVAGAALGIATAGFVLNRREIDARTTLEFQPSKDGWLVSFSRQF